MRLDICSQREIDIQRLAHAIIQHAQPFASRLLQFGGTQQITGLHDNLQRIGEIVGEFANLQSKIFRNLRRIRRWRCLCYFGHNRAKMPPEREYVESYQCKTSDAQLTADPVFERLGTHDCRVRPLGSRHARQCRSGGIGRRAWFRSMYSQGCGGSSPPFGTKNFFHRHTLNVDAA
jgi:hypothetical protein